MDYNSQICIAMDMQADGKDSEAYNILQQCITSIKKSGQSENLPNGFYFWGMCLHLMDEPEQALLKFEKAVQVEPDHEKSLWQITSILFYNQQSAQPALSILENKLLKINPDNPEYLEILSDIKSYLKHTPESNHLE